jgi:hypothetical protein
VVFCTDDRSTHNGSCSNMPRALGGSAVVRLQSQSPASSSQRSSPSVSTMHMRAADLWVRHHSTSRPTQLDFAALGDASRMNHSETDSACATVFQRSSLADRLAASRKIRRLRGRYHGVAKRSSQRCSVSASLPLTAWL